MFVNYYALLGVPTFCEDAVAIRRAYLDLALFFHENAEKFPPESSHEMTRLLDAIYNTLIDPDKRVSYDVELLRQGYTKDASYAPLGSFYKKADSSDSAKETPAAKGHSGFKFRLTSNDIPVLLFVAILALFALILLMSTMLK